MSTKLGKLDDVLNTIVTQITNAINNTSTPGEVVVPGIPPSPAVDITVQPGQVFKGFPLSTEMVAVLGQGAGNWQVSVFALPGKTGAKFRPIFMSTPPTNALSASVARVDGHTQTITFAGSPTSAYSVNVVFANQANANVAVTSGQADSLIATNTANAINALSLSGISASATGAVCTVIGPLPIVCNVGGTGTMAAEVMRVSRMVQVTIWASDPDTRELLYDAIISNVGIVTAECLPLSDGAPLRLKYAGDRFDDDSQSSYTLYVCHFTFAAEYGIIQTLSGYQIGVVEAVQRVGALSSPFTTYNGL